MKKLIEIAVVILTAVGLLVTAVGLLVAIAVTLATSVAAG